MQRARNQLAALLAGVALLSVGAAQATVLFDRPPADPFSAGTFFSDVSTPREATSSFQLGLAGAVQSIAWRGGYFDPTTPGSTTSFAILFFADELGVPASTPFYSVDVQADVVELQGPVVQYAYTATLPQTLSLPAGVPLWISIAEDDPSTAATFTWRKSSETGTSFSRAGSGSPWQPFPGMAGFELFGTATVPEPATSALLGIGIVGLASARRSSRSR